MIDPYRLVVVSIVSLTLLLTFLLFYRFIFPKRPLNYFILAILFSLLPIISLLRSGAYESGDFNLHIYRVMDFYDSLSHGILSPSWASSLNAAYGYPLFIFLNPLPYYIISFFHFLDFSFIASMKLFLGTTYILSGVFMFLFVRNYLKSDKAAFAGAIFYLFAPYHLVDLHHRVAIGELTTFAFLPLLFLSLNLLKNKHTLTKSIFLGITIALIILSHQALAYFALLFAFAFSVVFLRLKSLIMGTVIGLLISSYALIPYIALRNFISGGEGLGISFSAISELLYVPWRYGLLFQGPNGEISSLIGYSQLIIIAAAFLFIIKRRIEKSLNKAFNFWFAITVITITLLFPLSKIIWETFPLIKLAIISSRLLLFTAFATSILAAIIMINLKKKYQHFFMIFIVITASYTLLNWGHRRVIPEINDATLREQLPFSTAGVEGWGIGRPIWTGKHNFENKIPASSMEVLSGKGKFKIIRRTPNYREYIIDSDTKIETLVNTWYFPGWNATLDNKPLDINPKHKIYPGKIVLEIPKGLHKLELRFKDLPILYYSKLSSVITILGSMGFLLVLFTKRYIFHKRS